MESAAVGGAEFDYWAVRGNYCLVPPSKTSSSMSAGEQNTHLEALSGSFCFVLFFSWRTEFRTDRSVTLAPAGGVLSPGQERCSQHSAQQAAG